MIDFNKAEEQKEFNGPIPAGSIVKLKMHIESPDKGMVSDIDPNLQVSKTNSKNHYLKTKMVVQSGTFEGCSFFSNFVLTGSEKASKISMSKLRAILEAARGIMPDDFSPIAEEARRIAGFKDLDSFEFPAKIGIDTPEKGDLYINNNLKTIITPDKEAYQTVMAGGEIISESPIPKIPEGNKENPSWASESNSKEASRKEEPQKQKQETEVPEWEK